MKQKSKVGSFRRYEAYYDIDETKESQLRGYQRNYDKMNEALELLGMFCLLTTRSDLSSDQALQIYQRHDFIEKAFDSVINELGNDRMLTHSRQTTEGKFFIAYLALILWSDLHNHLMPSRKKMPKTISRLLKEMQTIRCVVYPDKVTLLQPLTREQHEILNAMDITPHEFLRLVLHDQL